VPAIFRTVAIPTASAPFVEAFLTSTRPASYSARQWRMLLRAGRTGVHVHGYPAVPGDAVGAAG
jgi:hypothetical protein